MSASLLLRAAAGACLALLLSGAASAHAGSVVDPAVPRRLAESGAPVKVWIFLADKGFADAAAQARAVAALGADYPARAVARRQLRRTDAGLFDARDLPVAQSYVDQLQSLGASVHVTSRWLDAVSASVDAAAVERIAALPFVTHIRLVGRTLRPQVAPGRVLASDAARGAAGAPPSGSAGDSPLDYGYAQGQFDQIDLPALHAAGFTGAGVVVGILDSGFVTTHQAFHTAGHVLSVIAAHDFVKNDSNVGIQPGDDPDQHAHGTMILGTLAAYLPGSLVGGAFGASFILCKTEDITSETPVEEDNYVAGLEFIEQNGGDMATSSLGYIDWYTQAQLDGATAVTTKAVNVATANGLYCVTAAGNSGHDSNPATSDLIAPADALQVITCGAVDINKTMADFSSDGPTADGRVKPELLAMGVDTATIYPYDDVDYTLVSGTSLSTPLVAGAVACLVQAFPTMSVATLRERLLHTSKYLGLPLPDPKFVYGYGIVDALHAWQLAGTWTAVGAGTAGSNGVPALSGNGALVGNEPATLTLTQGKPSGIAILVIGLAQLNAPFKGGVLVPSVSVLVPGLPLDGAGATSLSAPWSPGLPSGTKIYFQCWIPDAAGPVGFAASNGLKATTP